ncbi:MAG: hypothetical protein K2J66_02095, partial [Muribaculaceae bacterium]|nr:hypothetical protein [Muribaculaceae bacterium]
MHPPASSPSDRSDWSNPHTPLTLSDTLSQGRGRPAYTPTREASVGRRLCLTPHAEPGEAWGAPPHQKTNGFRRTPIYITITPAITLSAHRHYHGGETP